MAINEAKKKLHDLMRARLLEKGTNVERWAREHGYKRCAASTVTSRYIGQDERPTGPIARQIIEGLEKETGMKLCG